MRRVLRYALALCAVLAPVPERAFAQIGAPLVGLEADVAFTNNIVLSWTGTQEDPGHEAELFALGAYTLFGSLSPGGPVIGSAQVPVVPPGIEDPPFEPSVVIPRVPDGTYWIVAVKGATTVSTAPASAWVQVVINANSCGAAPGAPTSVQNLPTPGMPVALSWTPASGCQAKHFLVAAGTQPGLSNVGVVTMSGVVTILHGTAPEGTYFVRVHASNDFGVSGPSNEVQINIAGCAGPGPPHSLSATVVGGNRLQLTWSPPASGDLTHLLGYRLIGRIVGSPVFGGTVDVGPITSLLSGPIASNSYEIQVQAISQCPGGSAQLSAPSLPVTVTVP